MSKKAKRIIAIIGLAFMSVFSVTLVMCFAMPKWLNGPLGYSAIFTGAAGISLFLITKIFKTPEEKEEAAKKLEASYLPPPEIKKNDALTPNDADNKNCDVKEESAEKKTN